eukprot:COSAG02_NODE_29522_length_567_cov_2.091880_1_plen_83_part_10
MTHRPPGIPYLHVLNGCTAGMRVVLWSRFVTVGTRCYTKKHLVPTVTKRAQGILCNPLVPKLARLVPNYYKLGTKVATLVPKF